LLEIELPLAGPNVLTLEQFTREYSRGNDAPFLRE
jgi:hypothetical protein